MNKERKFEQIYEQYQAKVYRLVLGYVRGDETRARDLTQEVFIKIWENLDRFRGNSDIGTWIYKISVNSCLMFLRSRKSMVLREHDPVQTVEEPEFSERKYQEMYRCIFKLDELNRTIILLELQDLPQEEIAEVTGLSHAAVRTRIHRIKEKLSKCVSHE